MVEPLRSLSTAPVDPLPSGRFPLRTVFRGDRVSLEPLDPERHAVDLFAAGHALGAAARVWTWLPYGPFAGEGTFTAWVRACAGAADPVHFAVRPHASGRVAGMAALMRIRAADGAIEVGHIWFAPSLQRTAAATEALTLLIRHVFDDLGYRRLEWKCDAANVPSRNAALRLGFRFEGTFYRHMIVKGRNRDTAWFSLLDEDWLDRRAALDAWLDPGNFDAAGQQRQPLRRADGRTVAETLTPAHPDD